MNGLKNNLKLVHLKGKKVLVVGGAGFIGSHTADALIENGARVVIVDNLLTGRQENINPKATFYNLNIADKKIEEILDKERPDYIYLFAFFVLVPKSVENPLLDMDCLIGCLKVLKKAKEIGTKKVILASSGFLYGNTPNLPAKETQPIMPISPYVVSKSAIENYLKFFRYAYGLPYVVLRYAAVYGPRQITGAMADYIRKLYQGEQAQIWGDGSKTRDYIFIGDVIRINLLALSLDNNHLDPVFNVATGKETSLNKLYSEIAKLLGREPSPVYLPDRPGEQIRYCLDYSKAKKEFDWEPQVNLNEGLKNTVDHFIKNYKLK